MLAQALSFGLLVTSTLASPLKRAEPSLRATVSAPASVPGADALYVVTTLTNTGNTDLEINPLNTAFSKLESNGYIIDGTAASGEATSPVFVGPLAKPVTDVAKLRELRTLIKLAAGESTSVNSTLGSRYNFQPSGTGRYSIAVKPTFSYLTADATNFQIISAEAPSTEFDLADVIRRERVKRHDKRTITYKGCSSSEKSQIRTAAANAQAGAVASYKHLVSKGADSTYVKWFGAANNARLATVKEEYADQNGDFANLLYDCTCTDASLDAYVYAEDDTTVYLCPGFWETPACGSDSQQGILIHETSHFNSNGGTQDYVYGADAAAALALSNPAHAIANADNHLYYEEAIYTACSS